MTSSPNSLTGILRDVAALVRFRASRLRLWRTALALAVLGGLSVYFMLAFVVVEPPLDVSRAVIREWLPAGLVGVVGLTLLSAISAGGGRELIARDHAAPYPIHPAVDHLGALLLAPLNIAWFIQAWALFAVVGYLDPDRFLVLDGLIVLWLIAATAWGQVFAWLAEIIRRMRGGKYLLPVASVLVSLAFGLGLVQGRLNDVPAVRPLADALLGEASVGAVALGLVFLAIAGIAAGVVPAYWLSQLPQSDENRLAGKVHRPVPNPESDLEALARIDAAGVWRSAPLRRGVLMLVGVPVAGIVLTRTTSNAVFLIPSLVASGAALLFAINAWALDGPGLVWRESLPLSPERSYWSRTLTVTALVGGASGLILVVALAVGMVEFVPSFRRVSVMVAITAVCAVQIIAACMWWSVRSPHRADLTTARAVPAPPIAMLGYSTKLAVSTTCTALFVGVLLLIAPVWWVPVVVIVPFVTWSWVRWRAARRRWLDPYRRAAVVATVSSS